MTERYWEGQVGAIHYEISKDTRQLLYKQRNAKLAAVGSSAGKLAAKLSPVAEAMASIAPLAFAGKELSVCMIAQKYLQWKPMPERAQLEEIKLPVFDHQAVVERHRENERREAIKTARLVEFARLRAGDEYEAGNRTGALPKAAPSLKLVTSNGVEVSKAEPLPLTTGDIAFCFAGLRWSEQQWKKPLGDKPKWLAACIAIPGARGVSETRWNPVLIGAALEREGHAKQNSIRARFQKMQQLAPWLDAWKTYEADNFGNE